VRKDQESDLGISKKRKEKIAVRSKKSISGDITNSQRLAAEE